MSESDPQHADIPRYPGQDRPAGPDAESMDPDEFGDDDARLDRPSKLLGHEPDAD